MLRKGAEPDWDSPTNDELEAFETLKRKTRYAPDTRTPKSESALHNRHGCVCESTRGDVVTATNRKGSERVYND